MALYEFVFRYWIETLFGAIVVLLGVGYKLLTKQIKRMVEEQKAVKLGTRATLRYDIITVHNRYIEKGHCPIYWQEVVEDMHKQYAALGGNGTVTKLVEDLKKLPTARKE